MRGLAAIVAAFATACASHSLAPQHATVWGVTLDNDADISARALAEQADALASLPIRPLSRVVMDAGTAPADYAYSVPRIARVSRVMAELGDSSEVKGLSLSRYSSFVRTFVTAFRKDVDIWEIGNEVNGEWVGQAREEMARVQAAYDIVKAVGERTALTLYYNPGCYANRANELFTWLAARHVPPAMGAGLDYVTISYYPGDCNDYWPSAAQWQRVFDRLHAIFPRAKLGFGESGHSGGSTSTAHDIALLSRYTNVRISGDNYIGGYFWWTWAEDAVPKGNAFWKAYAAAQR